MNFITCFLSFYLVRAICLSIKTLLDSKANKILHLFCISLLTVAIPVTASIEQYNNILASIIIGAFTIFHEMFWKKNKYCFSIAFSLFGTLVASNIIIKTPETLCLLLYMLVFTIIWLLLEYDKTIDNFIIKYLSQKQ